MCPKLRAGLGAFCKQFAWFLSCASPCANVTISHNNRQVNTCIINTVSPRHVPTVGGPSSVSTTDSISTARSAKLNLLRTLHPVTNFADLAIEMLSYSLKMALWGLKHVGVTLNSYFLTYLLTYLPTYLITCLITYLLT